MARATENAYSWRESKKITAYYHSSNSLHIKSFLGKWKDPVAVFYESGSPHDYQTAYK